MPHKNSGGKPAPQAAARPAPARKPPPQPVNRAPPLAPVQSSGSGGSLLGNIVQGMAYGAGNAVAQRTIDAVLGPRTIQHETVDPAPAASNMDTVLKILGYGIEALKYVMSETETPNSKKQFNSSHNNERGACHPIFVAPRRSKFFCLFIACWLPILSPIYVYRICLKMGRELHGAAWGLITWVLPFVLGIFRSWDAPSDQIGHHVEE